MPSDIGSAYAARDSPMSSWPLAGSMLATVLTAVLVWNMTGNSVVTVVPTVVLGGLLTVRYGPSPSRVLAYALSLGVLTAAVLAGWVLLLALARGATATPLAVLQPVSAALVGVAVGIPLVAVSVYRITQEQDPERRSRLRRQLSARTILLIAGGLTVLLLLSAVFFVYAPFLTPTELTQTPQDTQPSSSAGASGVPYAGVSITTEQTASANWDATVYVYQLQNADYLSVTVNGQKTEVRRAGETVELRDLGTGDSIQVTVTREGTTNEVRTVTVGDGES